MILVASIEIEGDLSIRLKMKGKARSVRKRFKRQQCVSPWQITIISPTCVIFTIRNLPFHACAAGYETYSPRKKEYHREGTLPWLFDDARLCINFPSRWNNLRLYVTGREKCSPRIFSPIFIVRESRQFVEFLGEEKAKCVLRRVSRSNAKK